MKQSSMEIQFIETFMFQFVNISSMKIHKQLKEVYNTWINNKCIRIFKLDFHLIKLNFYTKEVFELKT